MARLRGWVKGIGSRGIWREDPGWWNVRNGSESGGFDLHPNVAVPAAGRARLEHLCCYLLRPAVAQGRLRLLDDGRILITLKPAWVKGPLVDVHQSLGHDPKNIK